ncbi:hypothetical protein [Klebsiella aerogenes EA1509E]|nr:hypothetical protein [Klebsiella aerogenes EA1509E]
MLRPRYFEYLHDVAASFQNGSQHHSIDNDLRKICGHGEVIEK